MGAHFFIVEVIMEYLEECEEEEKELIPDDWTEQDEAWWNNFVPALKEALFISSKQEIEKIEALKTVDIEISDDFKIKMNKLFRDSFGEDCKVPHPEVETKRHKGVSKL